MLRVTAQKKEEKERVRRTLLRAALKLGAEFGFSSVGLREVARAAAIAPTSFYRHFADMSELGAAIIDELVHPLVRSWAAVASAADEAKNGARLVDRVLATIDEDPELVRFVVAECVGASQPLRTSLRRELDAVAAALSPAPKAKGRSGGRAPSRLAAEASLALLLDGVSRALDAPARERGATRARMIETLGLVLGTHDDPGAKP